MLLILLHCQKLGYKMTQTYRNMYKYQDITSDIKTRMKDKVEVLD